MAEEIERKFLVVAEDWRAAGRKARMRQGYLCNSPTRSVRVRLAGERAWIGVKAELDGIRRLEFEYPVPVPDAEVMLDRLCADSQIDKTRHYLEHAGHTWEIDEFHGANQGLVVAEVELESADQAVELPPWVGREVSTEVRFYNAALVEHPIDQWTEAERARFGIGGR